MYLQQSGKCPTLRRQKYVVFSQRQSRFKSNPQKWKIDKCLRPHLVFRNPQNTRVVTHFAESFLYFYYLQISFMGRWRNEKRREKQKTTGRDKHSNKRKSTRKKWPARYSCIKADNERGLTINQCLARRTDVAQPSPWSFFTPVVLRLILCCFPTAGITRISSSVLCKPRLMLRDFERCSKHLRGLSSVLYRIWVLFRWNDFFLVSTTWIFVWNGL